MKTAITIFVSALAVSDIAQAGCTLYQHRDYGGSSYALADNSSVVMANNAARCESTASGGRHGAGSPGGCQEEAPSWNDQVSSFRVSSGCTLTMWQHIGEGGARFVRSNNVKFVGSSWNDQASEARCSCN
jgi:hypothetical protein